jgi:protein ImuA
MRLRAPKTADALWCAERVLQAKSCGALILWQQHIRTEALRRLHLAAQASETLLVLIRPLASAQDASPATLRLGVRPADGAQHEAKRCPSASPLRHSFGSSLDAGRNGKSAP